MALRPKEAFDQVQKYLRGLSRKQQITLGGGTALVVLSLFGFVFLIGRADYKPLYSGLQPEEAQFIARTLAAESIPYEMSTDATSLRVPANKVDSVRLELASQGLPQTGRLGLEVFDKPNWAGSDFAERVNYQRALEGELERTIRAIRQVQSARVHLVMPHDSLFSEREREAKASVVVKLREGKLADSAIRSITYLVASAVDDLRPENVTVIDADGNIPILSGRHTQGVDHDEIEAMESRLTDKLVSTLAPLVGREGLRATVTVEYDLASSESTQETYDPNGSVVLTSQVSQDQSTDADPQGIPGTPSNAPDSSAKGTAAAAASDSTPEQAGERNESKTYAVSKAVRHVVQPSGGIKKIAAAILVDDAVETKSEGGTKDEARRKRSADEMKQIEELAKAAIGIDPARGDHLSVQNISFAGISPGPPPNLPERLAPLLQEWMGVVRYAGLAALFLLIYVLVLRPVKRQIIAALAVEQPQLPAGTKGQKVLGKGEAPQNRLTQEVDEGGGAELTEITTEVKKTVVLKNQLVEKIKKNPEAASRLIQNWVRQGEVEA